jgi:hypothetical protein
VGQIKVTTRSSAGKLCVTVLISREVQNSEGDSASTVDAQLERSTIPIHRRLAKPTSFDQHENPKEDLTLVGNWADLYALPESEVDPDVRPPPGVS